MSIIMGQIGNFLDIKGRYSLPCLTRLEPIPNENIQLSGGGF